MLRLLTFSLLTLLLLYPAATAHNQTDHPLFGLLPLPPVQPITLDNAYRLQKLASIGIGDVRQQLAWSPDGNTLAAPASAGIWLYDAQDWGAFPRLLESYKMNIETVAYSLDGRLLFGGSSNSDGRIYVWETTGHQLIATLETGLFNITQLVLSPDGTRLAAADQQTGIILWKIDDQASNEIAFEVQQLSFTEASRIRELHFTPDGTQLYVGIAFDEGILVFDSETGAQNSDALPVPPEAFGFDFAFSPDGQLMAGQVRGELQIWNLITGEHVQTLPIERSYDLLFMPDSQRLLVSVLQKNVELWDVSSGEKLRDLPSSTIHTRTLALSPDKTRIAYGSLSTIEAWSLATDDNLMQQRSDVVRLRESNITFSPANELFFVNYESSPSRGLWRIDLDSAHFDYLSPTYQTNGLAFDPTGDWLLTGGNPLRVWYLPQPVLEAAYPQEWPAAWSGIAFHPDGQSFVSGGSVIRVWDFESRLLTHALGEQFGLVEDLTYNDTGTLLASVHWVEDAAWDDASRWTTVLWDTQTYEPLLTLEGRLGPVAFQPGTDRLLIHECLAANNGLCETQVAHLVDTATGDIVYSLPYGIESPVFSADGSFMVGGLAEGDFVLWDMLDVGQAYCWAAHDHQTQVALSPDRRYIVTMSSALAMDNGVGWVWGVPVDG